MGVCPQNGRVMPRGIFFEKTMMDEYFTSNNSLFVNAAAVSSVLVALTSVFYCCCHFARSRSPQRTQLYGRIHEVSLYRPGTKRGKNVRLDPFAATGLDMVRKFEDAVANYLYSVFNEVAVNRLDDHRIDFQPLPYRSRDEHYHLDYKWMVNHIYQNAREYSYLYTGMRDRKMKDAVFKLRSEPVPVDGLLDSLRSVSGPPYSIETIHSVSCHLRALCGVLVEEGNGRGNGLHISEGFESTNKDIRMRVREGVVVCMRDGFQVVEILHSLVPRHTASKVIRDHHGNVTKLYNEFLNEFLPCSDISLGNRKEFHAMDPHTRKETIMAALNEVVENAHNEEIWEVLAITVLPRFRKTLY